MWAYLNGEFLKSNEAKISPLDRGFTFGDGVYEVIPSYNKKLFLFQEHLERLRSSLSKTFINEPDDLNHLEDTLLELHNRNIHKNQFFYIQISRGAQEERSHLSNDRLSPTVFITSQKLEDNPYRINPSKPGLKIRLEEDLRWGRCDIKTTALMGNILSMHDPSLDPVDEIVLFKNGKINEGSKSNIFMAKKDKVYTPPLSKNILPGITRNYVIQLLQKNNLILVEEEISIDFVYESDEIWLTSSTKEIQPVAQVGEYKLPMKKCDHIWKRILSLYIKT